MNRTEELNKLLADFRERFGAIVAASMEEIDSVREESRKMVSRYQEARDALDTVESQIGALEAERDGLPRRAYEANLNDDLVQEAELRERFQQIPSEIDRLEVHRDRLRGELADLRTDPAHPEPELDSLRVQARQAGRPATTAFGARADLEGFRKEIGEYLQKAIEPVDEKWRASRGWVETVDGMISQRTRDRQRAGVGR